MRKLNVLLTGATGMVGEGVLMSLLSHPQIGRIVVLGRRPCEVVHPRLTEIVHANLHDIAPVVDKLAGLDACFFCLGTSSVGMSESDYTRVSETLTLHVAQQFLSANPGSTFAYISGVGTDSSERGRTMWARVKGRTENALAAMGFKASFGVRPGGIEPNPGQVRLAWWARSFSMLYPVFRFLNPDWVVTMDELARAMIESALREPASRNLEPRDIRALAKLNLERNKST